MDSNRNLIGTRAAAEQLDASQQQVRNWIREGRLPAFVVPGKTRSFIRIDQNDVDQFYSENYGMQKTENT